MLPRDKPNPPSIVKLLKISQVADLLQISQSSAYRLTQSGNLPAVRFGGSVRVRPKDLENFIMENLSYEAGQDDV